MATVNYVSGTPDGNILLYDISWGPLLNGDVGNAFSSSEFADRTVQVRGTFGSGGTVTMQGSNDGTTWGTINDAFGNALTITDNKPKQVTELVRYMRPNVTAGDGTTSVTVMMHMRKFVAS